MKRFIARSLVALAAEMALVVTAVITTGALAFSGFSLLMSWLSPDARDAVGGWLFLFGMPLVVYGPAALVAEAARPRIEAWVTQETD